MIQNIAPEITFAGFSAVIVLSGWIWNSQDRRITELEDDVEKCPFPDIRSDIAKIKTDVEWLKKYQIRKEL